MYRRHPNLIQSSTVSRSSTGIPANPHVLFGSLHLVAGICISFPITRTYQETPANTRQDTTNPRAMEDFDCGEVLY